jgi:hypothetical protein
MNATKLEKSEKMQSLLRFLQGRGAMGATSWQIADHVGLMSVSTWISMLRHNGVPVECEYVETKENGSRVFRYWVA